MYNLLCFSTWSNGRSNTGDGWPDSNAHDHKDWAANTDAFNDLVPEFEPGKPWKVNMNDRYEYSQYLKPILSIYIGYSNDSY